MFRKYCESFRKFWTEIEPELIQNRLYELPNQLQGGTQSLETKRKLYGNIKHLKIGFLVSKENGSEIVSGTALDQAKIPNRLEGLLNVRFLDQN